MLPVLAALVQARENGCALSMLLANVPQRSTAIDHIQEFPMERSRELLAALSREELAIRRLLGDLCGEVERSDLTDGLRLYFRAGEIVNLRPSGNAPKLRFYAEASDQARAIELSDLP